MEGVRRALPRAFVLALTTAAMLLLAAAPALAATAVTEPSDQPVRVGVDPQGYPAPVTVVARGFEPYTSVFIEQCNGRGPNDDHWQPGVDCDLGSAPAAAIADANGVVTFAATDRNHAFRPFFGASPQRSFNCIGASSASPKNELEDFRDCQIRISTNNASATDDQVFVRLALPKEAKEWSPEIVPGPVAAAAPNSGAGSAAGAAAGTRTGHNTSSSNGQLASSHPSSGDSGSGGVSASSVGALVLVVAALAVGAYFLVRRRRTRRVAA
jgi:hypothetical protein